MISPRAGDNAQVLAVTDALGLPFETRRFANHSGAIALNLLVGPAAARSRVERVDTMTPPWPDLLLAAGTQSEPISADLRQAMARDGHRARHVFLGRPWMHPDNYDLVVTTPQYSVPPAANVMEIDLPLHRVTAATVAQEAALWAPNVAELPEPRIAVLVGGAINRYLMDGRTAMRIAREVGAYAAQRGGSLLILGSYRTPAAAMRMLTENLAVPATVFDWQRARREGNPYLGFLGLAAEIVVTGDSMTMLAEACATGKPVFIFDLGEGRYAMRRTPPAMPMPSPAGPPPLGSRLKAWALDRKVKLTNGIIPVRLHRDTRHIHDRLLAAGRAAWFGDPYPAGDRSPMPDDAAKVAARIRALMAEKI